MAYSPNSRETLEQIANWLGFQDETLSFGLKSPEDALKLWRYAHGEGADLPELADTWPSVYRVKALGYDPLKS